MRRKRGFFAEIERRQRIQAEKRARLSRQAAQERARAERERLRAEKEFRQAQKEADRERKARYLEDKKAEAAKMTRAAESRAAELDQMLVNGLSSDGFSTDRMRQSYQPIPFRPSSQMETAPPPPNWEQYEPPSPSWFFTLFKGYKRAVNKARARFDRDTARYQQQEHSRQLQLAQAQARHAATEKARKAEIDKQNAQIDALD